MVADRIVWRRSLCQKDTLSGITALTEERKQHVLHFIWEVVSESVYVCNCWAWRQQETKEMPPTLWMFFSCVVEESSYCVVVNIMEVDSDWMTTWYGNMGLIEIALPCGNVIRLHVMDTMSQHNVYCCISTFSGLFQSVFSFSYYGKHLSSLSGLNLGVSNLSSLPPLGLRCYSFLKSFDDNSIGLLALMFTIHIILLYITFFHKLATTKNSDHWQKNRDRMIPMALCY